MAANSKLEPPLGYPPLFAAEGVSLSPPSKAVDVNVGWVIEQPREHATTLSSLLSLSRRAPPSVPSLPLSILPEVTKKDFAAYVSQLKAGRVRSGKLTDDFSSDAPPAQTSRVRSSSTTTRATATASSAHMSLVTSPSRSSSSGTPTDAFESVPSLYFRPDFDLKERGLLAGIVAAGSLDSTQAALTVHLDVVECQLLGLIRSRAPQFFVALRDLQELQSIVAAANATSQQLQSRVSKVKQECIIQPLYIVAASRRRQHHAQSLTLMRHLRDTTAAVAEVAQLVSLRTDAGLCVCVCVCVMFVCVCVCV
jgi:hypothetical protein